MYFEFGSTTMFQALYCWTSAKSQAHTRFIDASDICGSMEHIYRALHLVPWPVLKWMLPVVPNINTHLFCSLLPMLWCRYAYALCTCTSTGSSNTSSLCSEAIVPTVLQQIFRQTERLPNLLFFKEDHYCRETSQ